MQIELADPPFNRAVAVYLTSKAKWWQRALFACHRQYAASHVICVFTYAAGSVSPCSTEADFDDEIRNIVEYMVNPACSIVLDAEILHVIGSDTSALAEQRFDVIRKRLVKRGVDESRIRTRVV